MRRAAIHIERIEPEQGEGDLSHELGERVEALHVRHLVHEHVAAALLGPFVGVLGKQHHGVHDPPGHRHAEPVAAHQRERAIDAQRAREALREREPAAVVDAAALAREPRHDDGTDAEPEHHRRRAERPEHEEDRRARDRAARRRCCFDGWRGAHARRAARRASRCGSLRMPSRRGPGTLVTGAGRDSLGGAATDSTRCSPGTSALTTSGVATRQRGPHRARPSSTSCAVMAPAQIA